MVKKPVWYPICLDIEGKKCLVVGGGKIAERKVLTLLKAGGDVTVVAPDFSRGNITSGIRTLVKDRKIHLRKRRFQDKDIRDAFLIIIATDDKMLNSHISFLAQRKKILVNVVDSIDKCNFIVPAFFREGNLLISVSTNGVSPALSRKIREQLKKLPWRGYRTFLNWMVDARDGILKSIPSQNERKRIFYSLVYSKVIDLLNNRKEKQAREEFNRILCTNTNRDTRIKANITNKSRIKAMNYS